MPYTIILDISARFLLENLHRRIGTRTVIPIAGSAMKFALSADWKLSAAMNRCSLVLLTQILEDNREVLIPLPFCL